MCKGQPALDHDREVCSLVLSLLISFIFNVHRVRGLQLINMKKAVAGKNPDSEYPAGDSGSAGLRLVFSSLRCWNRWARWIWSFRIRLIWAAGWRLPRSTCRKSSISPSILRYILNNSPGPFLIFMPLIGFAVKEKRKRNPFIFHCWIIGYVSMLMMTRLFPWQLFPFSALCSLCSGCCRSAFRCWRWPAGITGLCSSEISNGWNSGSC